MIPAWRFFEVEVVALQRLSPSFLRVTFGGGDLVTFADNGLDQRIKVVLPLPGRGVADLPTGPDWHAAWRALPPDRRNPIRTYTVRAVRESEVDVDFVIHPGGDGPASKWTARTHVGDKLALLGPDSRFEGSHGGIEFAPPPGTRTVLLGGDETAVPAMAAILERLPHDMRGAAVLEVPHRDDFLALTAPPGVELLWRARGDAAPGDALTPAVIAAADRLLPVGTAASDLPDVDVDREILWEVPPEPEAAGTAYTWLAGEAAAMRTLRRHLVGERGLDRRSLAIMGYWRQGRAEG